MYGPDCLLGSRIAVVGPSCSGKSTVANWLGQLMQAPVVELDALFWKPSWAQAANQEFTRKVATATEGERWILDGHYERIWDVAWERVETVIWLDLPLGLLLTRLMRRSVKRWLTREVLWGTNRESLWAQLRLWDKDRSLLAWTIADYHRRKARYVDAVSDPRWCHIRFIRLCSYSELRLFQRHIESRPGSATRVQSTCSQALGGTHSNARSGADIASD